ncbi:hypothetical protein JCM19231_1718 [Vibrio ishigakensis]|uniref:Core-binding (CB) domain-containing protein n=1 Tax=Vibrio ishigakensis TaxID=1481914 RepID=A0A0B8P3H7_9VIBR|nr:phage integrase SAM-like domain-containing protein [Vibrio ishigakensis]GAM59152.1 hypothetical protein JCM19231_1718 [Vibrio ishigakensis]
MSQKVNKAIDKLDELQAMIEKNHKLRYKPSTLLVYIPCLRKFCNYIRNNLNFTKLTLEDIVEFINRYLKHLAPSTINNYIRQIRCLTREAYIAGVLKNDLGKMIKNLRKNAKPADISLVLQEASARILSQRYQTYLLCEAANDTSIVPETQTSESLSKSISLISIALPQKSIDTTENSGTENKPKLKEPVPQPHKTGGLHWLLAFFEHALSTLFR